MDLMHERIDEHHDPELHESSEAFGMRYASLGIYFPIKVYLFLTVVACRSQIARYLLHIFYSEPLAVAHFPTTLAVVGDCSYCRVVAGGGL